MHIAESCEEAEDGSWLSFNMRKDAYFHDGHPIDAEDVEFTHRILQEKGTPIYRARFYRNVASVEALDQHRVKFTATSPAGASAIQSIATFPVFPKHYWETRDFGTSTLEPPLGSAPYRIAAVNPGRSITYERVPDYWARDLDRTSTRLNSSH